MSALGANVRLELDRLVRSQRIFLLIIAPVAGPIGSAIAFVYFDVGLVSLAQILGLFVTGGLGGMVLIDLCALTVGEDLSRRSHLTILTLPQPRASVLAGRLLVSLGAPLLAFLLGGVEVYYLAGVLVHNVPGTPGLGIDPLHLLEAMALLLFFLGAIAVAASMVTRNASGPLVVGILGGVVAAAGAFYFLHEGEITMLYPGALGLVGVGALGWSAYQYEALDS